MSPQTLTPVDAETIRLFNTFEVIATPGGPRIPWSGLWWDYSQPEYQGWIITVTSVQNLAILVFLGTLVTYTNSRWWIVSRALLISLLRPIQLPESKSSIRELSQAKAIILLIPRKLKKHRQSSMTSVSPWFGVLALANIVSFLTLGSVIPYFLTGGGSSPTKVRLQPAAICDGLQPMSPEVLKRALDEYIYCNQNTTCEYKSTLAQDELPLIINDEYPCPFKRSCISRRSFDEKSHSSSEGVGEGQTVVIKNINPSYYGLNINNRFQHNYLITCAPLRTEWYYFEGLPGRNLSKALFWIGFPFGSYDTGSTSPVIGESSMSYNTIIYSKMGRDPPHPRRLEHFTVYELDIYPSLKNESSSVTLENFDLDLHHSQADMFVVLFKNGYQGPMGLPTYSTFTDNRLEYMRAHGNAFGLSPALPTASSLGCYEQYQTCLDERCTEWSGANDAVGNMSLLLDQNDKNGSSIPNPVDEFRLLLKSLSVQNFLQQPSTTSMLLRTIYRSTSEDYFRSLLPVEDWKKEVIGWLRVSFLMAKLNLLSSAQGSRTVKRSVGSNGIFQQPSENGTDWICDKLLFMDENASNFNFIGLMATVAGCITICLFNVLVLFFAKVKQKVAGCWSRSRRVATMKNRWIRERILIVKKAIAVALSTTKRHSRSSRIRTARGNYADDEFSTAIDLDELE